jgi:hypothetical protein
MTGLIIVLFTKQYSGAQIEKNETGGACSAYGEEERYLQGYGGEPRGKETNWKTQVYTGG